MDMSPATATTNEDFLTKHKVDDKESLFGKSQFIMMRHAESMENQGMTFETRYHK